MRYPCVNNGRFRHSIRRVRKGNMHIGPWLNMGVSCNAGSDGARGGADMADVNRLPGCKMRVAAFKGMDLWNI